MSKEPLIYIGETIKRLRAERSQEKMAEYCKLNRSYFGELERNEKCPSFATIIKLAYGFEMNVAEFINELQKEIDFHQWFEGLD